MIDDELLRKVKLIELTTRKMVSEAVSGTYKSSFKGHGVQFSEHRLYVPGDDIRHIDWKVSARVKEPLIKKFDEERELAVFLVVDVSGSESFGSLNKLKSEVAAEIAGMIAYAATHTGDKVGALLFAGEIEQIIPPRKGKQHILRIVRDLLVHKPQTRGTNLADALRSAGRIMKHSGVVFVISDFIAPRESYDVELKRLGRKHDVVAISIGDEREANLPPLGQVLMQDPESGEERLVDTASYAFQKWHKEQKLAREEDARLAFRGGRVELLKVQTREDYAEAVVRFFRARARRR
jgi:uncharacterized protein (DUF58 family)